MWNNNIFWVLLAPGVVSFACFAVEGFSESWRRGFEAVGRGAGKLW
jgi:hypothetical protein